MPFINFTKSKNVFKSRITNNIFLPLLASIHHTDKMKKNIHTCVYRAKYRLSSRCVFKLFYCSLPMHENPTPFPLRCAKKRKRKGKRRSIRGSILVARELRGRMAEKGAPRSAKSSIFPLIRLDRSIGTLPILATSPRDILRGRELITEWKLGS